MVIVQWIGGLNFPNKAGFARFDDNIRALVFVGVQAGMVALAHEPVKKAMKLREPFHSFDAGDFARFFFRQFVSFPSLGQGVRLAEEQDFALILFVRVGINQENRFLLLDASEIEKVGIGAQQQDTIGVCGQDVIAVHDGQRVWKQQFLQFVAMVGEQLAVYWSVSHFVSFNFGLLNARMTILEQDGDNAMC